MEKMQEDGYDIEYFHLTGGDVQAFKDAGIKSTPTLVLLEDGVETDRILGVKARSEIIEQFKL